MSTSLHVPASARRDGRLVHRTLERLAERREEARRRLELELALAGHHGPGVQAEVRAALER
jgi:hypothetical protein